jgi:type IV pilus assembly protein PilX
MHTMITPFALRRQDGAALIVGLLLLMVLTLLAISGMNTASLELVMAGNTQYQQNAFQAAEGGIEQTIATAELNPAGGTVGPTTISFTSPDQAITTVTPQMSGQPLPAIWGTSWDSFSTYHFEILSEGTSARNARAENVQAIAVVSPADSTVAPIGTTTTLE